MEPTSIGCQELLPGARLRGASGQCAAAKFHRRFGRLVFQAAAVCASAQVPARPIAVGDAALLVSPQLSSTAWRRGGLEYLYTRRLQRSRSKGDRDDESHR